MLKVDLPPLRERRKDIPLLAEAFLHRHEKDYSKPAHTINEESLFMLSNYSWPGNVRELESVMERAVTLSQANEILPLDLPAALRAVRPQAVPTQSAETGTDIHSSDDSKWHKTLQEVEEEHIRLILDKTEGNRSLAARILGIDRRTLYRRLDEMGLKGVGE